MTTEITDPDLAAAIQGREHWRPVDETTAEYDPGQAAIVRVGRIARPPLTGPTRHDRYYSVVIKDDRALHRMSVGFAREVVSWAERVNLS